MIEGSRTVCIIVRKKKVQVQHWHSTASQRSNAVHHRQTQCSTWPQPKPPHKLRPIATGSLSLPS